MSTTATPSHRLNVGVLTLALALAASARGTLALAQQRDDAREIDRYVRTLADDRQFSGGLLVARGPNIVFEKAYGRRDFRTSGANTTETLFAVASVTKQFTAIATRRLAEQGVLTLDDPVSKWLPDFPNGERITITHLLSHRSGIPHRVTKLSDERAAQTAESMVRLIAQTPLRFEPGAQRLYSSAGYTLLARILERASGKPFATLLHELVLAPANATSAIDATETSVAGRTRAVGHFWTPNAPLAAPKKQLSFLVGAGSLLATPRDLFRVARRVADGGYGASVNAARAANGAIQWTGWSNGSLAMVNYDPATDVTIVLTSNLLTGAADWIMRDAPRILAGESVVPPTAPRPAAAALSRSGRAHLEGVYDFGGNEQSLVFLSPSVALLGGEYLLYATGERSLFAPQNYATYAVVTDSTGKVTALRFEGDNPFVMRRLR